MISKQAQTRNMSQDDARTKCFSDPDRWARQFIDERFFHTDGYTVAHWRGEYYRWTDSRWEHATNDDFFAALTKYLSSRVKNVRRADVANCEMHIRSQVNVSSKVEMPSWRGTGEESVIAVRNGLLNLKDALARKEALTAHTPNWFSSVCLPYDYDPNASCDRWQEMLHANLDGDDQRIDLLQQWCGYCLTRSTDHQKFLLMVGEGGNGKSVVLGGLTAMLGFDNVSTVPLEDFGDRFSLTRTLGKLANIVAEIGPLDKFAEGKLKEFTAGDRMKFEQKYKDPIEAVPTAKLVLSTNNLPRFRDRSSGLWRRMLLLPFDRVVPPEDRIVGMDKPSYWLRNDQLPGMLNWAIDGLRRLNEMGQFVDSAICHQRVTEFRQDSNPEATFLTEHYRQHENSEIRKSDVYDCYRNWCNDNGYKCMAANNFGKEVNRVFNVEERQVRDGNHRHKCYVGIAEGAD